VRKEEKRKFESGDERHYFALGRKKRNVCAGSGQLMGIKATGCKRLTTLIKRLLSSHPADAKIW